MTRPHLDDDALVAAADLVGRTGAQGFEIGYLHDDVPAHLAAWYAHAQYRGTRITSENHPGPVEAAESLARRLLTGARCTHCGGLIALSDDGATAHPGRMLDGTEWTEAEIRAAGQCRYRRRAKRWVRGCEGRERPGTRGRRPKTTPKRRKRR